jgi:hypothetical protein
MMRREVTACLSEGQAAMPSMRSMNCAWPRMSAFGSQRICPLRIMFMASYPAMVLTAPSTDQNP